MKAELQSKVDGLTWTLSVPQHDKVNQPTSWHTMHYVLFSTVSGTFWSLPRHASLITAKLVRGQHKNAERTIPGSVPGAPWLCAPIGYRLGSFHLWHGYLFVIGVASSHGNYESAQYWYRSGWVAVSTIEQCQGIVGWMVMCSLIVHVCQCIPSKM